eukprot:TRINITY_DN16836_c0_g1_i1.p1 TRINITY_DN16836_c0_g1~~TRINITY_DN16836_c0_g1_i1.p1  ORF type:complete len:812 (+),score=111.86 TRINITY_DN16836_c0_g1_i1:207-2642(+)
MNYEAEYRQAITKRITENGHGGTINATLQGLIDDWNRISNDKGRLSQLNSYRYSIDQGELPERDLCTYHLQEANAKYGPSRCAAFLTCDLGKGYDLSTASCKACVPGRFSAAGKKCDPCPAGDFQNASGTSRCKFCPKGRYSGSGASTCTLCDKGTAAPDSRSAECKSCTKGYFQSASGQSECLRCSPGTYQPASGASNCTSCGLHLKGAVSDRASIAKGDCVCPQGFLRLSSGMCGKCDSKSMICPGLLNDTTVTSLPYHMLALTSIEQDRKLQENFLGPNGWREVPFGYRCMFTSDCPGNLPPGECPEGHKGIACAQCMVDWSRSNGDCTKCDGKVGGLFVLLVSIGLMILGISGVILHILSKPALSHMSFPAALATILSIFINYLQLQLVLPNMSIEWPSFFKSVMNFFDFLALDLQALQMDCIFGEPSAGVAMISKAVLWTSFLCTVICIWSIRKTGILQRIPHLQPLPAPPLTNSLGFMTNIAFVPLAMSGVSMLNCFQHPSGGSSMKQLPGLVCFEDRWTTEALPAGILLFLLVTSVYSFFIYLICVSPSMEFPTRINFMLARFRPEGFYWGACMLTRNLTFAAAPILSNNPFVVSAVLVLVAGSYLLAICRFWPWKTSMLNSADLLSMFALMFTIHAGVSFTNDPTYPRADNKSSTEWSFLQTAVTAPMFMVIAGLILILIRGFVDLKHDLRGKLASEVMDELGALAADIQDMISAMENDADLKSLIDVNLAGLSIYDLKDIFRGNETINRDILGQEGTGRGGLRVRVGGGVKPVKSRATAHKQTRKQVSQQEPEKTVVTEIEI